MEFEIQPRIKRYKQAPQLRNAPEVHSIEDLIELADSLKFYKNIDTEMLWKIHPYLKDLSNLVGMEKLKETIFYQVIYYLQGFHLGGQGEYLHTVIYGPPGSGKTTVAKIIGKIYQSLGILSEDGPFRIAHRDDFIAGYVGQSTLKTKKFLKSCLGGVLFIDEVYSLVPHDTTKDSFAKEVVDLINSFLSEHKDNLCCIIAGYEEDIKKYFFSMNKGLERRFPWVHKIEEYSYEQLYEIFHLMATEQKWSLLFHPKDFISILKCNKTMFKHAGGDIETFFSKCKMMHARRVFSKCKTKRYKLTIKDLESALEFLIKNNLNPSTVPPLDMYI